MLRPIGKIRRLFASGGVIPAHPLALTAARRFDSRRQRALSRYYLDAGARGLAVGVHTTQFGIRDPKVGLLEPVLELAAATAKEWTATSTQLHHPLMIAGVIGPTRQALREARLARDLGYDAALLSMAALHLADTNRLIAHARAIGEILPLVGFYLQPGVGGRRLEYEFWRKFCDLESVVAIKVAPFNRYDTLDVVRAIAESGRAREITLLTGNDDHILLDLMATHTIATADGPVRVGMPGGLLGQWACWTHTAVAQHAKARRAVLERKVPAALLTLALQLTEANAAIFDAAHQFRGCIPGIHEILRRQGLLRGRWCLDPQEELSPGQLAEIDRVCTAYPHLTDDAFVREHRDRWLS
jgi:dihydrodipicolinate synthase/N-acetylneuraminate lyase